MSELPPGHTAYAANEYARLQLDYALLEASKQKAMGSTLAVLQKQRVQIYALERENGVLTAELKSCLPKKPPTLALSVSLHDQRE